MPISLIKKNQLDPNVADLVGKYGSGFFLPIGVSGQLSDFIANAVKDLSGVVSLNTLDGVVKITGASGVNVSTSGNTLVVSYTGTPVSPNVFYTTGDQTVSGNKTFTENLSVEKSGLFTSGISIGNNSISITPNTIDGGYNALDGGLTDGLLGIQYSGYFDSDPQWFATANVKPIINELILTGSTESEFNGIFTRVSNQNNEGTSYFSGDNGSNIYYYSQYPSVSESTWRLVYDNLPSKFVSYDLEQWIQNPQESTTGTPPTGTITQTQNYENSTLFDVNRALLNGTSWEWVGYFKANHTSNHNFYIGADEEAYFWIGDKAINAYTTGNADMYYGSNGSFDISNLSLISGVSYPVRMQWGHPSNPTNLGLYLSYRNGVQGNTSDFSGLFFQGSRSKGFIIDQTNGDASFAGNIHSNTATFNNLPTVNGNPLLTGANLSSYATLEALQTGLSGVAQVAIGYSILSAQVYASGLSGYIENNFYAVSNPSGFITTGQTGAFASSFPTEQFITTGQSGLFYPANNPSGFITGINTSLYITTGQTGNFYSTRNPSGYITTGQTGAFYPARNPSGYITTGQTGAFYPARNPSGYITTGQTGAFYAASNPSGFIKYSDVSLITGNSTVTAIVYMTQSAYNAITPVSNILYIIT